jgi:hypothetical protein
MSDRHAGRLLPYQAHMCVTRHLRHVLRSWITKEEAGQLPRFLSGIFAVPFITERINNQSNHLVLPSVQGADTDGRGVHGHRLV